MKPFSAALFAAIMMSQAGCVNMPMDPSIPAAQAGDYTLVVAAGTNAPASGLSAIRVKEGSPIDASMSFVVPNSKDVVDGELVIDYRDIEKSYTIVGGSSVLSVPFSDILGPGVWQKADSGTLLARLKLHYRGPSTIERVDMSGLVFVVVHSAAYTPLPLDSGPAAFVSYCKVSYTTAGRSSVDCSAKPQPSPSATPKAAK